MEECKFVNTCRTCLSCLSDVKQFQSIFMPDERIETNVHFSEMISAFTSVQITLGDGFPEEICNDCADKTIMVYVFKQQVEECERILRKKYDEMQTAEKLEQVQEAAANEEDVINSNVQEALDTEAKENVEYKEETYDTLVDFDCAAEYSEEEQQEQVDKLEETEELHHEEFLCEICDKKFTNKDDLLKHKISHDMEMEEYNLEFDGTFNMDENDTIIINDSSETLYCCEECKSIFIHKEDLDSHLRICEAKAVEYYCKVCSKTFNVKKNFKRHMKLTHRQGSKKLKCGECPKTFKKAEWLDNHLKVHSGMKPHTCDICFKGFNQLSNLKDHLRTHNGEKPFLCSTCGKGFNQLGNLRQHTVRHSGIKAHLCSTCGNGFASKGELSAHLRKHTGARPFVCSICNHAFTTSSSLTKHKRIHSGERPYECDVCHVRFSRSGILARHKRTHTGEKPYMCKFCGKAFIQSNDLTSHLRIHTGEKPYICHICGHPFRQSSALKTHKKMHLNQAAKELKKDLLEPKLEVFEILQDADLK